VERRKYFWSDTVALVYKHIVYQYHVQFSLIIPFFSCSFAIDWRPAQKSLVFLKSASVVCSLEVEEGYPRAGRARLGSIRRDAQPIDTSVLQVTFNTRTALETVPAFLQLLARKS